MMELSDTIPWGDTILTIIHFANISACVTRYLSLLRVRDFTISIYYRSP